MRSYAQRMRKPQLENLRQSTAAGHMSNQAVLGVLNEPDGDTRFSEALRAKFEAKPIPQSERSRPMALAPDVLQKAEKRYQTPLAGLKAYEDTGLLDSGYNGYAQGNEIHVDDSLAPAKREEVLMHEIGHVVQRGSGMAHGSGLLDNPTLEQQADQGFAAPQSFAMPASSAGPVMGMKGVMRGNKGVPHPKQTKKQQGKAPVPVAETPKALTEDDKTIIQKSKPQAYSCGGSGAKKGKFVGKTNGHHIHIVSDATHYKVGGTRTNLNSNQNYLDVLSHLSTIGMTDHGVRECYLWVLAECLDRDLDIPPTSIRRDMLTVAPLSNLSKSGKK